MRIFGPRRRPAETSSGRLSPLERLGRGIEQMLLPERESGGPELRVVDRGREVVIRLVSRRFDPRTIRIQLEGRVLTLSAATGREGYHAFRRRVLLPKNIDWRRIDARAGDRVLTLRIPKVGA